MSGTTTAQTVQSYYQNILFRTGDANGVAFWTNEINNVGLTPAAVENLIATSAEATTNITPIVQMYEADLGRAPDTNGLAFWVHQAEGGMSLSAIDAALQGSPEGQAYIGNSGTVTSAFITKLYNNILNRAPDAAGQTAWLNSGLTAGQIEDGIRNSAEAQKILPTAATNYLMIIGNGGTVSSNLFNANTGPTGNTITLTTAVQSYVGTPFNDTFVGVSTSAAGSTVLAGDSLNGNGGTDALQIIYTGTSPGSALAGVTLSNIQTLSMQNSDTATGVTENVGPFASISKVIALNSGTGDNDTVTGLAANAQFVASGAGTATGNTDTYNYATTSSAASVGVDGGINGTTLTDSTGTETSATISSTGAANGGTKPATADTFVLTAGANPITSLTVNAATNLNAILTAADFAATAALTVSGAATSVNLGSNANFKTINAANLAGGLTIALGSNLTSFAGGGANNVVTTAAALGATTASEVNAGTGTGNVLNLSAAGDIATATLAKQYANFQTLKDTVGGAVDVSLLTNSQIAAEQISGLDTLSNLSAAQAAAITVIGNTTPTLNWNGSNTPASTIGLTVNDAATAASTVTITAPTVTGTNAGSTVNLAVANANDTAAVTSLTGIANLTTLTVSGTGSANITTGALAINPSTVINAGTLAGKFTLDASLSTARGIGITGGVGVNNITVSGLAATNGTTVNLASNAAGGSTVTFSGTGGVSGTAGPADTITLGTHTAADTVVTAADNSAEYGGNAGTLGSIETVNNFTIGSTASSSDKMTFTAATGTTAPAANGTFTAAQTGTANLTASVASGIVTFGGSAAGTATLAQLIAAAHVADAAVNSADAFVSGGNTYVVETQNAAFGAVANDHVFALNGVTGLTAISQTAAANSLFIG